MKRLPHIAVVTLLVATSIVTYTLTRPTDPLTSRDVGYAAGEYASLGNTLRLDGQTLLIGEFRYSVQEVREGILNRDRQQTLINAGFFTFLFLRKKLNPRQDALDGFLWSLTGEQRGALLTAVKLEKNTIKVGGTAFLAIGTSEGERANNFGPLLVFVGGLPAFKVADLYVLQSDIDYISTHGLRPSISRRDAILGAYLGTVNDYTIQKIKSHLHRQ